MTFRRRKGATLGLVAVCVMVIVVVGIGVYFLAKILGGGREVANATDAGALHVAKTAMAISVTPPPTFKEFGYPTPNDGITLLTYNRCVAKVMIVAMNAQNVGGQAPTNVVKLIADLDQIGNSLLSALVSNGNFNQASAANQHRLVNERSAVLGGVTDKAFMKPKGATNVFFSANVTGAGLMVPRAVSDKKPDNSLAKVDDPNNFYMAGYEPIPLATGQKIYGCPVFPQIKPHLVALGDFNAPAPAHGTAPPNAFKSDSNVQEQKTNLFTGAVACAIVGAINSGGSKTGTIGNGFEFPGALPYGYIEVQNMPANPEPPGFDAMNFNDNIFNNWLSEDTFVMGEAPSGKTQDSRNLVFSHSDDTMKAWALWANDKGPMPSKADVSSESKDAVYFKQDGVDTPVQLSSANAPGLKSALAKIKYPRPSGDNLAQPTNCFQLLSDPTYRYGLAGSCVPGAAAITSLTGQDFPKDPPAKAGDNFSNVDQVKAQVLVAFANKGNAPDRPYAVQVYPIRNTGLGCYLELYGSNEPYPLPSAAPVMAVPSDQFHMPLQQVGSIWQLLKQVGGCSTTTTLDDLVLRCQEIQPKTSRADVLALLKSTPLPMKPAPSTENYKMYIYLPNGDLSQNLVCTLTKPPGYNAADSNPDGIDPTRSHPFPYTPCQVNKYSIQGTIVNAHSQGANDLGDELVHQAPYLDEDPPVGPHGMVAYDWAHWWPGSGANNNLGRLWFENGAYNGVHFSHIN